MTEVERLANFVVRASYADFSAAAREQLKIRILDSLGCAVGALSAGPVHLIRKQISECEAGGPCSLIGGGSAAPDWAAFHNGALVRYLDFNDSYLVLLCHKMSDLSWRPPAPGTTAILK